MSIPRKYFPRAFACLVAAVLFISIASQAGAQTSARRIADKGNSGNPRVHPRGSNPYGASYETWTARWWQWAYSLPVAGHPLFDETGADCAAGQSGPVWYLGGVFNVSGSAVRDLCVAPQGKSILFPVLNAEWDNACPADDLTIDELRAAAASAMDLATDLACEVDGVPIENLSAYRFQSPVFDVTIPDGSIWSFFGCDTPAGNYAPLVGDGYYLMLQPLAPGAHTIHFHGTIGDPVNFTLDLTYHLTVGGGASATIDPGTGEAAQGTPAAGALDGGLPTTWGRVKSTYR